MKNKPTHTYDYELVDSGNGRKLERFGRCVLVRPCAQAIWAPQKDTALWDGADATFERRPGKGGRCIPSCRVLADNH
jgi:23S rRNA (cytosine1962-C5)-methyltransferase